VTAILVAEHVGYRAGSIPLISDVSLTLTRGRVLAVVGPNGAGKSTLLHLLAGDLRPTEGTIQLDSHPLHGYSPTQLARRRAVMTQHTVMHFAYQVEQVVAMGRYPHAARRDITPAQDRQIVLKALQSTETDVYRSRTYPTLSGGEASRTIMARAIAQETDVLLLDEPTAGLDIRHQELVMRTCRTLAEEGKAVCVILHDLNLAAIYADEIALLDHGRLAAMGAPFETLIAPLLSEIYGHPIYVTRHPRRNCPLVLADDIR
jgi:iron complex transport system ATP-binding protein